MSSGRMTDEQVEALLVEQVRITKAFREAVLQISSLKTCIVALLSVLEMKGLVSCEELDAAREEVLKPIGALGAPGASPGMDLPRIEFDEACKWKM